MKRRSLSAHKESQHPGSNPKQRYERVETDYSGYNPMYRKGSFSSVKNNQDFFKKMKIELRNVPKQPEQIFEQNMNLKSFINNLQKQLTLQRSRLELSNKNNLKFTKQLNREFSKELYYSGSNPNGYMISGVKHQYAHMKSLYEAKCKEFQALYKKLENTEIQELRTYIQTLQEQNSFLKSNIQSIMSMKQSYTVKQQKPFSPPRNAKSFQQKGSHYAKQQQKKLDSARKNAEGLALLLAQEKQNLRVCMQKLKYQSKKIEKQGERQVELLNKIEFLERLLIEKGNSQSKARRAYKKVQIEKVVLQKEAERLRQQFAKAQGQHKRELNRLQQHEQKKLQVQKRVFQQVLTQKSMQLANYEKEVRYLTTMLSYWKPLDEIKRESRKESLKDASSSSGKKDSKSIEREEKLSDPRQVRTNSEKAHELQLLEGESFLRQNTRPIRPNIEDQAVMNRANSDNPRSQKELTTVQEQIVKARRDCSKKHSDKAKRVRRVDPSQISKIGEVLRYKLLGHQINIQAAKSLLCGPKNIRSPISPKEQLPPLITMHEIKAGLMEFPFLLSQSQAIIVSRYIVEDANSEYVYWDEQNEIDRNIAKSILKAVIGEYSLTSKEEVAEEWKKVQETWLGNMMAALKQVAPKGKIGLAKFTELMAGLGVEMSQNLKDWLIGALVIQSNSLEELQYAAIARL